MDVIENKRQYVVIKFNPSDLRTYTYHNDGPPVAVGDKVEVETKRGTASVEVVAVDDTEPNFATKPCKLVEVSHAG